MHDRHDLIDEQWALLVPLLPDRTPRRGGQWNEHRLMVDGVLWRTRTGSPWRDLPASYGNWKTVYNRHRRWSADGTWARVLSGLQRGCDGAAHLGAGRRVGAPTSYVDSRRITRVPVSTRSADHVRVGTSIP